MLDLINKLSKLKIEAFETDKREGKAVATIEAMFNPETFSMKFESVFQKKDEHDAGAWHGSGPKELAVTLIFDGTEVSHFGIEQLIPGQLQTVSERVQKFLATCHEVKGKIHEPHYLRISWGKWPGLTNSLSAGFDCRLKSVDIKYTSFGRDGSPLRAELSAVFLEKLDPPKEAAIIAASSPDLSHVRVVQDGDTLPLLCAEIYGSSHHYLAVAAFNGLDHFRFLTPGVELLFPPADQLEELGS
jgi:hypothetical protein